MLHINNSKIKAAGLEKLKVKGLRAPLELRRHPTARRLTLRVSRSRRAVILTMPKKCSLDEAGSFLHRHLDWVHQCIDDIPDRVCFEHDALVPLRGVIHKLSFTGITRATMGASAVSNVAPGENAEQEQGIKSLPLASKKSATSAVATAASGAIPVVQIQPCQGDDTPRLEISGLAEHAPRRVHDWLVEQSRKDLGERVQFHARNLSLRPKRFAIRDQSTRWGSCSSSGCLSFSWRLIMAPSLVLDYLAAHEVAHLAEMNHGARFWQLVEETMPRMNEAKDWLRREGMDLHRYGA